MEVNSSNSVPSTNINTSTPVQKKQEQQVDVKKPDLKINTKDYLKIDTNPKGSMQVYSFLDTPNTKETFSINTDKNKPKDDDKVKANYDKDKKVATIESNDNKLSTKTVIDDSSKIMTTEIVTKGESTNFKVTGGYDNKDSQLKTLGIESISDNTNVKALYDPQKTNIAGEVTQKIGNQNVKIKSDYDFKGSDVKNFGVETSDDKTSVKTLFNTGENSLSAELNEKSGSGNYKVSGKYNLGLSSVGQFGVEYGNDKGIKVNTDFSQNATDRGVKFRVSSNDIEFGTDVDMKNKVGVNNIEVAKPVTLGKNLPTAKFSVGYDSTKNDFSKLGVDLNANIDEKVTVTFSSNLAQSARQHSVKLNYDVYTNTKIGIEANLNEVKRDTSGYKLTFSSGFKF